MRLSSYEVVLYEVYFLQGCLPLKLSSYEVFLPKRSSSFEVVFL